MGRIEDLAEKYRSHITIPWQRNLSGDQKTIFVVYPKADERQLRARLELFEMATTKASHKWKLVDLTSVFAEWMASEEYRDEYFADPSALEMSLEHGFTEHAAERIRAQLRPPTWTRIPLLPSSAQGACLALLVSLLSSDGSLMTYLGACCSSCPVNTITGTTDYWTHGTAGTTWLSRSRCTMG